MLLLLHLSGEVEGGTIQRFRSPSEGKRRKKEKTVAERISWKRKISRMTELLASFPMGGGGGGNLDALLQRQRGERFSSHLTTAEGWLKKKSGPPPMGREKNHNLWGKGEINLNKRAKRR